MADQPGAGAAAAPAAGAPTDSSPTNPNPGGTGTGKAAEPGTGAAGAAGEDTTLVTKPPEGGTKEPAKPGETGKAAEPPQGAPETYTDFKLPEGVTVDPEAVKSFQGIAKELNLTQENAQKLVDFQAQVVSKSQEAMAASYAELKDSWKQESLKTLGAKAEEQLAFAARTRDRFGSKDLNEILNQTGLGNHPAVVKLFVDIGKAISEDNLAEGTPAGDEKSLAQRIFGSTSSK